MLQSFQNLGLIFGGSKRPVSILLKLALGSAERLTLPKPLPTQNKLHEHSNLIWKRYDGITVLRRIPLFNSKDTPTNSIYRMCEFLCSNESNRLMLEMQYFWDHPPSGLWRLCMIPDPQDHDTERYAVLASLVESLVLAFNNRTTLGLRRDGSYTDFTPDVEFGLETCPSWTRHGCKGYRTDSYVWDEDFYSSVSTNPFSKRNIVANAGILFSI